MVEKERQTLEQILKAKAQAVWDFKASFEMKDIKVNFAKEAFIKEFELCQRNMIEKFSKLDLSFLDGRSDDEVGPSIVDANLPSVELSFATPPSTLAKPAPEPKAVPGAPSSSTASPPEVGDP